MAQNDVFISYSRKDEKAVQGVVDRLEADGFKVWIDKDGIESGDAFKRVIVNAIENSSVVLFFSSESSNKSPWTAKEIGVAIYEEKPIIPVKIDKAKYNSEIKFDLINKDYVEFRDGVLPEEMYRRLVKSLRSKCGHKKEETEAVAIVEPVVKAPEVKVVEVKPPEVKTPEVKAPERKPPVVNTPSVTPRVEPRKSNRLQSDSGASKKEMALLVAVSIVSFFFIWFVALVFWICAWVSKKENGKLWQWVRTHTRVLWLIVGGVWAVYFVIFMVVFIGELFSDPISGNQTPAEWDTVTIVGETPAESDYSLSADDAEALENAIALYDDGRGEEALPELSRLAGLGDSSAQTHLGAMYLNGYGVETDYFKAQYWLKKAGAQNETWALRMLGEIYAFGEGVPEDQEQSYSYYRQAADLGDIIAQEYLDNNFPDR